VCPVRSPEFRFETTDSSQHRTYRQHGGAFCPFVFTMPKRFRLYFRFDRDLLRKLPKLAWETVLEVYRAVLDRDDVAPGMVAGIQTHGQLSNWHPHIHALVTDGAFTGDATFIPLPDDLSSTPFLKIWESKVFRLLLAEGRITEDVVDQMRSWKHSGFSVDSQAKAEDHPAYPRPRHADDQVQRARRRFRAGTGAADGRASHPLV